MAIKVFDVESFLAPDALAMHIVNLWRNWKDDRSSWEEEKKEIREYLFATDTTKTGNSKLPWKNKTTLPKLTQIRDNLHANYMATLFPNRNWLKWKGADEDAVAQEQAEIIEAFMTNKHEQNGFEDVISKVVYDWVDYGNAFAGVTYANEIKEDPETGDLINKYTGPQVYRISPHDIVFDIAATDFASAPKVTRIVKSLGDLVKEAKNRPELGFYQEIVDKIRSNRVSYQAQLQSDTFNEKNNGMVVDGFDSLQQYYESGWVELLEFEGDIYDHNTGELLEDYIVTVVDRSYVIRKEPNKSWLGNSYKFHIGWRERPDNLMAMGPLDNLVGMQYRIDHLENLKADVFDFIAFPVQKVKGNVDDYTYEPGARIYMGDDGDVDFARPDATALNADNQIALLQQQMEEMAGAPRQAMGIRTPGEKTAFEVQSLDNASSRIFTNKTNRLESTFLEKVINSEFEIALRNMSQGEQIPVVDAETGAVLFQDITKEDIQAKGKLKPIGARHFAERATLVQDLNAFANSAMGKDPAINTHISGKKIAELMFNDIFDLEARGIVSDNIRVLEGLETQRIAQAAQEQLEVEQATPIEGDEEEPEGGDFV